MSARKISVLSLPSYHWYMSKFNDGKLIYFVNPNSDFFTRSNIPTDGIKEEPTVSYLDKNFPRSSYDLVHIHFEYRNIKITQLKELLQYFKRIKKPIIWTVHDRRSNDDNSEDLAYEKLLFEYSDKIITLTESCKEWVGSTFGLHKTVIEVLPHGYIEDPRKIKEMMKEVKKDPDLFTILYGNFRPNKEVYEIVNTFLLLSKLKNARLRLMFNPVNFYDNNERLKIDLYNFLSSIRGEKRIEINCEPFIEHDQITRSFLESHAIILPYKWGTHSGQIELARDCGCYAVTPNVGFYREQWSKVILWEALDGKRELYPVRYANALIDVYKRKSFIPNPEERLREFVDIYNKQYRIYSNCLKFHET